MALDQLYLDHTDLPPLTLAVVVLEQTLVVRDAVFTEHETIEGESSLVCIVNVKIAGDFRCSVNCNGK